MPSLFFFITVLIAGALLLRPKAGRGTSRSRYQRAGTAEELSEYVREAYKRGVADGARSAMESVQRRGQEATTRAFRQGYEAGVAARNEAPRSGQRTVAAPRNRSEALAFLELPANATAAEIRERIQLLRRTVHPDALRGKGFPEALVEYGQEHFKLVGVAKEILERG